jgi:hypothetical protein
MLFSEEVREWLPHGAPVGDLAGALDLSVEPRVQTMFSELLSHLQPHVIERRRRYSKLGLALACLTTLAVLLVGASLPFSAAQQR